MTTTALSLIRPFTPTARLTTAPRSELLNLQTQIFQATRTAARPVRGLMSWVLDRRNLTAAWDRVSATDGADTPGPDGVTCSQLKNRVGPYLADLAEDLFHRRYFPSGARWVDIPKPNNPAASRRIGILNVRDRVVQTAIRQVVEPVLEPTFLPTSFGFRPGRSVAGALDAAASALSAPANKAPDYLVAVPLDVADCFPTIEHAGLLADLAAQIADPDLLDLIGRAVAAGGEVAGRLWWQRRCGLVQGGPLSPLLCNLALHTLDAVAARLTRDTRRGVLVLRYADDLLLLARDAATAKAAVGTLRNVLRSRWQRFKAEPTPVPASTGVEWLGVRLQPRRLVWPGETAYGYAVPEAKTAGMIARLVEMTAPPSDKIDAATFNLGKWIVSVNTQLRDWRQAYLFADNAPDLFRLLDQVAFERIGELLRAVHGVGWAEIRRNHFARLPRGFRTWEVPGARLSVLSSLAPCAPAWLTRRPSWWKEAPNPSPAPTVPTTPSIVPVEGI
jgi:group II intron reverse transcriptase/maturase